MRSFHPHPPHPHPAQDTVSVTGRVEEWTYNPHNHLDGFSLEGGPLIVKFPPHFGAVVASTVTLGDEVTVDGVKNAPPAGDAHLVAFAIASPRGRLSLDVADLPVRGRHVAASPQVRIGKDLPFPARSPARPGFSSLEARLAAIEEEVRKLRSRLDASGTPGAADPADD